MVFRGTEGISRCCVKGGGVIRKLTAKEGGGEYYRALINFIVTQPNNFWMISGNSSYFMSN